MPRRDQISETKKQRLQEEQERLQKLMFDARSSVRRSSLKGLGDTGSENRLYPPLRSKPDTTDEDEVTARPESAGVLWPKLSNEQQPVREQPEEPPTQRTPLTEKDLFPAGELLTETIKEQEPLAERVEERGPEKRPLTEQDLFPERNAVADLPRQPQERIINVILPEQNTAAAAITPLYVKPVEIENARGPEISETPTFYKERIESPEEKQPVYTERNATKKSSRSGRLSYAAMVLAALLLGFGGYYFYTKKTQGTDSLAERQSEPASVPVSKTAVPPSADSINVRNENTAKTEPVKPSGVETKKPALKEPVEKTTAKPPVAVTKKPTAPAKTPSANLGQYKVISKAYFHNEPDESTRRKAFIIHWNNAVLTPLEEKSGFVYIVFTNHLGQTSKGWLRKKDLQKLN
jgi:hypothetical protein